MPRASTRSVTERPASRERPNSRERPSSKEGDEDVGKSGKSKMFEVLCNKRNVTFCDNLRENRFLRQS